MTNKKPICTYCGKPVRDKHTFSYGFPGMKRAFGCDRLCCRAWHRRTYRWKMRIRRWAWRVLDNWKESCEEERNSKKKELVNAND